MPWRARSLPGAHARELPQGAPGGSDGGIWQWPRRAGALGRRPGPPAPPGPAADRAVTALYHSHYAALVRQAALLVGDVATAEDVVQDCFIALHRAWWRVRDTSTALFYLRRSVINKSRSVLRRRAVAGRQREVLVLRYYADLPETQIAAVMGISRGSVKAHAARARDALRAALADSGPST